MTYILLTLALLPLLPMTLLALLELYLTLLPQLLPQLQRRPPANEQLAININVTFAMRKH